MTSLERLMARAGVSRRQLVEGMHQQYPLLSERTLRAMLAPSESGSEATDEFLDDLCRKYHIPRTPENRKKKNRLYCRLTDEMWERFESVRVSLGFATKDEMIYRALLLFFAAYEEKAAGSAATLTTAQEGVTKHILPDMSDYVKREAVQ